MVSMVAIILMLILFAVFHQQMKEEYLQTISEIESEDYTGVPIFAHLLLLFEILMVPGSVLNILCGLAC